jgi:polysaccharide chain length determinant protein (PEP-CTERM system associated)
MDDLVRQVISILRGTWQQRWIGLAVAWIVGAVAAVVIVRMPDKFEASARIYVDTQSLLKPLMSGLAIQPNVEQQVNILSRTLISRPNVEKLIRMADLDLNVKSKEQQESLIDGLMKSLEIKSAGRDNLYTLAYRDSERERAKRVVQSLTSIFVESSLGDNRKDADSAKRFIEDQIAVYQKKLEEAENRLKEFKLRHIGVESGEGRDYFSRMGELNTALNQARLELREAENSRDALKRQIAGEEPVLLADTPDAASGVALPEIDGRIETLKRNLDSMLQRFTDEHPDVIGTRRVIKDLEEQKREQIAARKAAAGPHVSASSSLNSNPVYQQLKVSHAEAEANVASLQTRVAEYDSRYNRMKASMQMVPQVEAEFAQLNRDYDVHKKNYEQLVARRESASMSGDMEKASVGAEFRLIDPPRVPDKPVAPNRLLLFPLALVGALGAGAFASFAASQLRPTFFDLRMLREVSGMPVLGSVSLITNERIKRRERRGLIGFMTGVLMLIGAYGTGLVLLFLTAARTV